LFHPFLSAGSQTGSPLLSKRPTLMFRILELHIHWDSTVFANPLVQDVILQVTPAGNTMFLQSIRTA